MSKSRIQNMELPELQARNNDWSKYLSSQVKR
jgi:hypothetical protein